MKNWERKHLLLQGLRVTDLTREQKKILVLNWIDEDIGILRDVLFETSDELLINEIRNRMK